MKSYTELSNLHSIEERFEYLKCPGVVGEDTFGGHRYLNQRFYTSPEWKQFRNQIIIRDSGCDMGVPGQEINGKIIIHHINPITIEDIVNRNPRVLDPENAVCVSELTHKLIHYGEVDNYKRATQYTLRTPNDTCPWLK